MAQSKEEIKAAYPLPVYNYRVEIGSDAVAFSEVSGLSISYETVKEHVQHILRKIGVSDRTQAAVWAVRKGLV